MLERRLKTTTAGWALRSLVMPLLLSHCAKTHDEPGDLPNAGAGGAAAPSGVGGALGGTDHSGGASASASGAAGSAASGELAGESAGGDSALDGGAGAAGGLAGTAGTAGSGGCYAELRDYSEPSAQHVALCSAISYPMNPPVYGDHYPVWAAYKSYSFAVPLGFLVHNLEHGAIVILYNCPDGCADEVATAQALIDALPADPRCAGDVKHQVVMSPDPSLATRWAAAAWGHSLSANCFSPSAFLSFYNTNVAHGSEDICSNGADLLPDTCQ